MWFRWLVGRRLLAREADAYRALDGLEGVPKLLSWDGTCRLVISYIEGAPLPEAPPERLDEAFFDDLAALLHRIHDRGVACADLHHRNVIVSPFGKPSLVDFAMANVRDVRGSGPLSKWLCHRLAALDEAALTRMRTRYLRRLPTPAEQEILRRGLWLRRAGRTFKRALPTLRPASGPDGGGPVNRSP